MTDQTRHDDTDIDIALDDNPQPAGTYPPTVWPRVRAGLVAPAILATFGAMHGDTTDNPTLTRGCVLLIVALGIGMVATQQAEYRADMRTDQTRTQH